MTSKPRVLVIGPVCNISGYSEHARTLLDSLMRDQDKIDLYVQDTQWSASTRSLKYFNKYEDLINKTIRLFQSRRDPEGRINIAGLFDSTYQVRPPNEFQKMSDNDVGVTAALETTFAPPEWVSKCNEMNHILVVSEHAKKNLKNTKDQNGGGISTPITVIPFGYDSSIDKTDVYSDMNITTKFNFLTVLQMAPRKNFENMLKWFVEEFKDDEDVGLVVKTNIQNNSTLDFYATKSRISAILNSLGNDRKCKIYFVHGNLTEEQMISLYNPDIINCYITATHGEGFGIPIFNAACNGIPVVATNWSGHLDFLRMRIENRTGRKKIASHFLKVGYDIKPVQNNHLMPGLITESCLWAYPKEESFKKNIRLATKSQKSLLEDSERLKSYLLENQSIEKVKDLYSDFNIKNLSLQNIETSDLPRISIITSVYDGEEYIEEFLHDITRQTIFEEKCELILINANSPGNEEETILKYVEKYPNNIVYQKLEKDPGIYGVWNKAIKMSSGEYITNANLDDRKSENSLEVLAKSLYSNDSVDLVYSDMLVTDKPNETFEQNSSNGRVYNTPQFSFDRMKMMNLPHAAPMWRRSLHDNYGYFDEEFRSAGDWEMWLRAASQGSRFLKVPQKLNLYYFSPRGISTNPEHNDWKQEEEKKVYNLYKDKKVG